MNIKFIIIHEKERGEASWGWYLLDSETQIAKSIEYSNRDNNLLMIKSIKGAAIDAKLKLNISDGKEDKPDDDTFYLNVLQDNSWNLSKGRDKVAEGLDKLKDKSDAKYILESLARAKIEYHNPEDDPANKPKGGDNTVDGMTGSFNWD